MGLETNLSSAIPCSWSHEDKNADLSMIEWCRWNGDGSYYINWERAEYLASQSINNDMRQTMAIMMAKLLTAQGNSHNYETVTLERANEIAKETADKINTGVK